MTANASGDGGQSDGGAEIGGRGRGRRGRLGSGLLAVPGAAAVVALFVLPALTFFVYSFLTGAVYSFGGKLPLTLSNYSDMLGSETVRKLAENSVIVGGLAAIITLAIAIPVGYWLRYCAGRWQRPALFLVVLTFFASYLVRVYAWRTILGSDGLVNQSLERLGLIDEPLQFLLYSRFAVTLAIVHLLLPVVILVIFAGFRPLDPRYLECAQDLGAGFVARWRLVILPLLAVPVVSAVTLCFILASSDYVTPQLLGGPGQSMIGVEIQNQFKATGNYPMAAALSMTVVAVYAIIYGAFTTLLRAFKLNRIEWRA
jgi:ABC-type spermidine/putrescine transport system permease subunit I